LNWSGGSGRIWGRGISLQTLSFRLMNRRIKITVHLRCDSVNSGLIFTDVSREPSVLKMRQQVTPKLSTSSHSVTCPKTILCILTTIRSLALHDVSFPFVFNIISYTAVNCLLLAVLAPIQLLPAVRRPGHEADHCPSSSADVKNA
jgi:hypothetical protein